MPKHDKRGSYARFMELPSNRPAYYPVDRAPDPALYRPAAAWIGRLILPAPHERERVMGACFEVHYAPPEHAQLVGSIVWLRWSDDPYTNARFWGVTRQVMFDQAAYRNAARGWVLPERVNTWPTVNPLESLAGALPADSMIVSLPAPVTVQPGNDTQPPVISTPFEPVQITGRYYALLRFEQPAPEGGDRWLVRHWNPASRAFDGAQERVRLPEVAPNEHNLLPASSRNIHRSPANEHGWYAWGACDGDGCFVIQSLGPRALLRVQPTTVLPSLAEAHAFLSNRGWREDVRKGAWSSAVLGAGGKSAEQSAADWNVGDAALLIHVYGGVGGKTPEPAVRSPLYFGHFAFGIARVIHEPLAGEPIFDIVYHQVYVHNSNGMIAGAQHWNRYAGDRQFGFLNLRPLQDILLKLPCFGDALEIADLQRSALELSMLELEKMTARYRIADGRGSTAITALNNCAQDSNQALYAAIKTLEQTIRTRPDYHSLAAQQPEQAKQLERLLRLGDDLRHTMLPLWSARADWEDGAPVLGSSLREHPLRSAGMALRSWRTMMPPIAARAVANTFLRHGAAMWVLRTYQIGGENAHIEPKIPSV